MVQQDVAGQPGVNEGNPGPQGLRNGCCNKFLSLVNNPCTIDVFINSACGCICRFGRCIGLRFVTDPSCVVSSSLGLQWLQALLLEVPSFPTVPAGSSWCPHTLL